MLFQSLKWIRKSMGSVSSLIFPPVCANCCLDLSDCPLTESSTDGLNPGEIGKEPVNRASDFQEPSSSGWNSTRYPFAKSAGSQLLCFSCLDRFKSHYSRRCRLCGAGIEIATYSETNVDPERAFWVSNCPSCRRSAFRFDRVKSKGNYESE